MLLHSICTRVPRFAGLFPVVLIFSSSKAVCFLLRCSCPFFLHIYVGALLEILFWPLCTLGSVESPTVGMLLINNVCKRWEDGYQMFCLFTLDDGGLV